MPTYQTAYWRLIIVRAHDWEQFALPTFSSTKLPSDWIYTKQKREEMGFGGRVKKKESPEFLHCSS